jgi:hypothetical protein
VALEYLITFYESNDSNSPHVNLIILGDPKGPEKVFIDSLESSSLDMLHVNCRSFLEIH